MTLVRYWIRKRPLLVTWILYGVDGVVLSRQVGEHEHQKLVVFTVTRPGQASYVERETENGDRVRVDKWVLPAGTAPSFQPGDVYKLSFK